MFTWICPQCGREVPPSYTECPDCAAKASGAAPLSDQTRAPQPPPQPQYPPPPPGQPPQYQQPVYGQPPYPPPQYPYAQPQAPYPGQPQYQPPQYPQYPPPYPQQYQQPVYGQPPYAPPQPSAGPETYAPPPPPPPAQPMMAAPTATPFSEPLRDAPGASSLFAAPPVAEPKTGMPTWLLTILCTAGFALVVIGAYWLFGSHKTSATAPSTTVESAAAKPGAPVSPWQKFIEISGVRLQENPKNKNQIMVKFLLTNHSESDLRDLAGNVTIWAGTRKSDEDAQGTFAFKTDVGPYASKEMTVPFNTKLKVYELPDWNVMSTDLQITNPAPSGSGGQP